MIGTLINTALILLGTALGLFLRKGIPERVRSGLMVAMGLAVILIGVKGALATEDTLCVILSMAVGAIIGCALNLEERLNQFGQWVERKLSRWVHGEGSIAKGFVTATLVYCVGAMAIVGAIQDGILGDWSILATKAVLDFIIIIVMTCSLGKGCIFSAIPVLFCEGLMTVFASFLKPVMTDLAMNYLSLIGSILIFCVGLNLVWGKKVRVANMLPAVVLAVIGAFLPF